MSNFFILHIESLSQDCYGINSVTKSWQKYSMPEDDATDS